MIRMPSGSWWLMNENHCPQICMHLKPMITWYTWYSWAMSLYGLHSSSHGVGQQHSPSLLSWLASVSIAIRALNATTKARSESSSGPNADEPLSAMLPDIM